MNAETPAFDDRTFDLVGGKGVLHRLHRSLLPRVSRVLKPGGDGVFI